MKKIIFLIAVISAMALTSFTFTVQANYSAFNKAEFANNGYDQVDFKDLPAIAQEILLREYDGFEIKTVFQNEKTKLLKVVVEEEKDQKTFIQNEEGMFVEQK